jgi:hypothetical protein
MDGISVHELRGLAGEPVDAALDLYREALDHYRARRFVDAIGLLEQLLAGDPADRPAQRLATLCRELFRHPPPADWQPINSLEMK